MKEKKDSYPNVSLGGKLSKQKGERDSGQLRYAQNDLPNGGNKK
jgi:hypothetical protein